MSPDLIFQLPNLAVFVRIAQKGNLQAVADELNMPRSSISKRLSQLEAVLGARLIERTTRKMNITQAGLSVLAEIKQLPHMMDSIEQMTASRQTIPQGKLRISCPTIFAQRFLVPMLPAFSRLYPHVLLELSIEDHLVDLIADKIDVAIRVGHLTDSTIVARRIGEKKWCWVASPNYLAQFGTPQTPADLSRHQCLIFKSKDIMFNDWQFIKKGSNAAIESIRVAGSLASNDARSLVELACLGAGILMVDQWLIKDELNQQLLEPILTDYTHSNNLPIYLISPSKSGRALSSNVFLDFFAKHFCMDN